MEAPAETAAVEQASESGPNSFVLFLIFVPTFLIAYLIPFLATIYSKSNAKKWIFYWVSILLASFILRPILTFCFGAYGGAFLFLVAAAGLIFVSSNEKANVMLEACDLVLNIVCEQWKGIQEKLKGLAQQFGLIE